MEQMSEDLKNGIIDAVGPYIEKDTSKETISDGDEVLDGDNKESDPKPQDSLPDASNQTEETAPDKSTELVPDVSDEPDKPEIPEIPEYILLDRVKYPLNKYTGLEVFRAGNRITEKEHKYRMVYGYGKFETTLSDALGSNPFSYFSISGIESSVLLDFDLSKAKADAGEGEISFSDVANKVLEFANEYCVSSNYISNLRRIELGSNPDTKISAKEYALLLNLIYDDNCKQNGENKGTTFINPEIRLITGKMSTINLDYIKELMAEIELVRDDSFLPIGGWSFSINTEGKAPEDVFFKNEALQELIEYRNENYNSIEIHLGDFGWDTVNSENASYVAPTEDYTSEEIQAMYILRAFLLLQGMDVDKASLDLINDTEAAGHGIIASNGTKKLSYSLLEYFKAKMNGMYLTEVVSNGENDVYCYKFEDANGRVVYAFWSQNGATLNLRGLPEGVTLSYYDGTSKAYADMESTTSNGMLSKRINEAVMFLEFQN